MHTQMGSCVDFMTGNYEWHDVALNNEQAKKALSQLAETLGDY
jgi:transketolase